MRERLEKHRHELAAAGQLHLLAFWNELDDEQRGQLLDDLDQVDLRRCLPLIETLVRNKPQAVMPMSIEPPDVLPSAAQVDADRRSDGPAARYADLYDRARRAGADAIASGRVAALTVAGGQGTRLGFDGPKGAFPVTPIRRACLFQVFAEYLHGVARRFGRRPPWYIMTSPTNHAATLAVFEQHGWFGLPREAAFFFTQGQMPAFLPDGRIALAEKHRVALSPDGHGGTLAALARSGALEDMKRRGVDHISYFQVDNPLVHAVDALFVGLHELAGSEMSSKVVTKAHDTERVGNLCVADGRMCVIEYSDLPESLAVARNADGSRRFDAGSIAVHVISRAFVERLTAEGAAERLPWHRAEKKVETVDDDGQPVRPTSPNAVKLETFIFDAIPLAANPLAMYTAREEEFSPVKNAEGSDSPATCLRDQVRRAARWLEACGVPVPRDSAGEPAVRLEISPAFALDESDLRERLTQPPALQPGGQLLLAP